LGDDRYAFIYYKSGQKSTEEMFDNRKFSEVLATMENIPGRIDGLKSPETVSRHS
jgi:hypothetical protein